MEWVKSRLQDISFVTGLQKGVSPHSMLGLVFPKCTVQRQGAMSSGVMLTERQCLQAL